MLKKLISNKLSPAFLIAASIIFYVGSMLLPAFRFSENESWLVGSNLWQGIIVLVLGWLGIAGGVLAWLANPLWLAALVSLIAGKSQRSIYLSTAALFLAFSSVLLTDIPINEGGHKAKIHAMGLGFYIWATSIIFLFAAARLTRHQKPASET